MAEKLGVKKIKCMLDNTLTVASHVWNHWWTKNPIIFLTKTKSILALRSSLSRGSIEQKTISRYFPLKVQESYYVMLSQHLCAGVESGYYIFPLNLIMIKLDRRRELSAPHKAYFSLPPLFCFLLSLISFSIFPPSLFLFNLSFVTSLYRRFHLHLFSRLLPYAPPLYSSCFLSCVIVLPPLYTLHFFPLLYLSSSIPFPPSILFAHFLITNFASEKNIKCLYSLFAPCLCIIILYFTEQVFTLLIKTQISPANFLKICRFTQISHLILVFYFLFGKWSRSFFSLHIVYCTVQTVVYSHS